MYQTKTDPPLVLDTDKDDEGWYSYVEGDRRKILKRGSYHEVMADYRRWVKHYEERAKAE